MIGTVVKADTSQARSEFEKLGSTIQAVVQQSQNIGPIVSSSTLPPVAGGSSTGNLNNGSQTSPGQEFLERTANKDLIAVMKDLIQTIKDQNLRSANPDNPNNPNPNKNNNEILKTLSKITAATAAVMGVAEGLVSYNNSQRRVKMKELEADPYGAQIEDITGTANAVKKGFGVAGTVGAGIGGAIGALGGPFGMILGAAIGKGVGELVNLVGSGITDMIEESKITSVQENQQKTDMYKARLPIMEASMFRFGNGNYTRSNMYNIQDSLLASSKDTGVSLDEFMENANSLARFGISDVGKAGTLTRAATFAARNTGTDKGSILNYLGTQSRYVGGNAVGNMNYAYSAALSSGLDKSQFGEFLDGLQGVIENGISKGYVKSTKDVSDTMVMFSKMSGSELWKGEQGIQRYNQLSSGLANATNLSNASQLTVYQALRANNYGDLLKSDKNTYIEGQDALNTLAMMERGLSVGSFNAIKDQASRVYGGDIQSEVMFWKEFSGLNTNGAMQLYNMAHNGTTVTEDTIKNLKANTEYQTDSGKMNNKLNEIAVDVSKIASAPFDTYLELLGQLTGKSGKELETARLEEARKEAPELAMYTKQLTPEQVKSLDAIYDNPDDPLHEAMMQVLENGKFKTPADIRGFNPRDPNAYVQLNKENNERLLEAVQELIKISEKQKTTVITK